MALKSIISSSLFSRQHLYKIFSQNDRNLNKYNSITFNGSLPLRKFLSTMKFVQYKDNTNNVKVGLLSENEKCVHEIPEAHGDMVKFIGSGIDITKIAEKSKQSNGIDINSVQVVEPLTNPQKILCIGLNYSGHCLEQNLKPPKEPMFFSKYASAIVGPTGSVIAHKITQKLDWEVEMAVIIGKIAKHVSKAEAMDYVFGYSVAQDISARDWQKERNGGQFLIGKSMDTFCPLGPSIVHRSSIKDPHNLNIKCYVNGDLKQNGNTSEMIYNIPDIIERITQSITLYPGDVILTGTPSGVGMHRKPPQFLKPGDLIESEIENIGKITNKVIEQ